MRQELRAGWWRRWVAAVAIVALVGLGAVGCDTARDDDAAEEATEEAFEAPATGMGDAIPPVAASPTPAAGMPPPVGEMPTPAVATPTPAP